MMNNYSEKYLNKIVLVFIFVMGLSGCGGGGDSAPQQNPPVNDPSTPPISNPIFQSITGAGIKGPLANAVVTIFAFDATRPGYKGAVVTTAATDATAAITGLNLPLPLNPPYIMEFTSVPATTDITTGTSPVITTIRTVITQALLAGGKDIYATPLTTLAVDIAVMNATDTNGTAGIQVDEFEAALALAASKVISTLGFGLNSSVDIFDTPPLINSATISTAEQAKVAAYRTAIEAITAIAYQISQQSPGATADTVLADLAADLADNDIIDGSSGGVLNANTLQVLQQIPSSLPIPNTSPVQTIADVQAILAAETAITGSTTNTTRLIDGTIVTQATPVRTNVDTDGDGVFNADDDLPDNQFESVDSDGDGIGDNADPDDDNDGILDEDEGLPSTPAENDTDGDGVVNGIDNCRDDFNPAQTNSDNDAEGDACDLDDDGDGVNDVDDAFPNDASKFIDTDSDGIDDGADADDDNDGIDDGTDVGVSQDGSTSCSLLIDCDGDGVLDGVDADRTDPNVGLNFAPIANNDNAIVNEGQSVNIDLAFNDTDDNNALDLSSIVITSAPSNGTLVLNADGTVEYTHDGSETITDSFTYNIADTSGAVSNVATVSLEVSVISIDVIADASVNENSVYTGVTPVITGTPIGAVTYTLSGTDAADFTIDASTGVVSMVARDFELPVDADVNNVYALVITATDADGNTTSTAWSVTVVDVIEVSVISIAAIADVNINENSVYTSVIPAISGVPIGAVTYTLSGTDAADFTIDASTGVVNMVARDFELPVDADVNNVYALAITVTDADGNAASTAWNVTVLDVTETATFTINAIADTTVDENSIYTGATPVITGTPIGALTYTLSGIDAADFTIDASTGVVNMVARDFELPADANTDNIYSLSIIATDVDSNSASQSWVVSVQNVVELLAIDDSASVNEGQSVNIDLATNDTADNTLDLSSIVITSAPSNGVLVVNVNGTVDYTHDGSETSTDSFTYTILDTGGGLSNAATVTLTVNPVNDLPVGNADNFTVDALTATVLDVLANDVDVDGTLTISNVSQGSLGSTVTHNGSVITFTDINNVTGSEIFTYDVTDGTAIVTGINVVVNVIANIPNTPPVANDDNVTTTVDTTFFFNVLANDTDLDGDVLSVLLPTPNTIPTNGLVSYNGSGTFTYSPNTGFIGTDSFTYTVTDLIDSAVGTVTITVTPPGTPIDMVTLMSPVEGGVAGIENAEANVYAYWTDNYNLANSVFLPEDHLYNHLSGVFDTVVSNGDLLLSGTQWVSEGDIIGTDDGNGGLDLTILDANNVNVEVARFKLTARFLDLNNVRISDHLNAVWQLAMVSPNATFNIGAKLITDYRFEALVESHILGQDNSCQKDGTTKFTDLNGNCNSVDVDAVINATGYAQLLNEVVAATAWVDPDDFSTPPGAVTIATNNVTNKTLMVQLVSGGAANYYVVDWSSNSAFAFVANAVAGDNWVQNTGSGVDMIHFQVPASFITQFSDELSNGLNNFLTVQNSYVRQGLKHAIGDTQFSDGQFNGQAFNDILANFSAPVIPGLAELTGTWVNSVASANGDPALIHIFANGNYESSGSCDLDGSTGMEYGTVSSSGSATNIIALAQLATQGSCGPAQGNKTLAVNADVLTLSEPGFADVVYNRLLGTPNPIVGSWLLGNIQDPGEAHTILTMLDDTTFMLSQDCTADSASGFEYGTYFWDQGITNDLTGTLTIDSNASCGLHNSTAFSISGFTVIVLGDTLTLTDAVGGSFIYTRISPAYVIPMLQVVYTLDNLMLQPGHGQITGTFTWSYVEGDFAGGSGEFTDLSIPGYGTDIAALSINFDIEVGIEITLAVNTNNNGLTIILNFVQPLSPTAGSPIDLATSAYEIEVNGLRIGVFVSGAILLP